MTQKPRVAIVDDEPDLRESVASYLHAHGFDTAEAESGAALDALLAANPADAILLDVNMPGEDGFSIARRLRAVTTAPIIMLTARTELIDRVVGLELGADDYIGKPFELRELLARVRAVLRRAQTPAPGGDESAPEPVFDQELWVQDRGTMVRVPVSDIELIRADRDYAMLHTRHRSYMLRTTMDALERALDPAELLRVHRSAFVRPAAVRTFRRAARGGNILLENGSVVPVGPLYLGTVMAALKVPG
ncbi:LytR/AlgR family response regulator transcription factor [Allosphingosinicella deserti]|uniref:DNA-binding response regulator n=1 Tax=Allosphingosinicella deserti TaxID=2116704 RepID=A0A2P7QLU3_9SPHN|nr:response regulator [Sphingomonas deserti]PSJ38931.1 DNA-binding response regulator [Sphingomonas deserti]